MDAAVLHDDQKGAVGVGEQVDVGDRVTVDQEQIGQGARFDDAEPAGIGIAGSAEGEQLGVPDVAETSTSAGVYQRVILTSCRPWRAAREASNRMSEPQATLTPCLRASW